MSIDLIGVIIIWFVLVVGLVYLIIQDLKFNRRVRKFLRKENRNEQKK